MAKNLIPEIAKMLGVEIGEEFKIKGANDWMLFHFEERGLRVRNVDGKVELSDRVDGALFERLLGGHLELIKLPWKPKKGEYYWTFKQSFEDGKLFVLNYTWDDGVIDDAFFKAGLVYRTKAEAEAALPKMAAEFVMEYKL